MRRRYRDQLDDLAVHLAGICTMVGDAMAKATRALLDGDLALAESVIGADASVDEARTVAEEKAYALLAARAPEAADLRAVLAAIHASENLERMGDLALHVAKAARRRHPRLTLPDEVRPTFARMGELAVTLAERTEQVLRTKDAALARSIEDDDDEMDELHRQLFTVLMSRDWSHGVSTAVDVTLLSRFYERFADHAVSACKRTAVRRGAAG
jgi:phosphate transport system protein